MKKTLSFLIALLLVILAGTVPALAEKNAELATVFKSGGTLRLVPAELPGVAEAGGEPVGISPDGKTVLLRKDEEISLFRDGKILPLVFNAQRGAGDVFGKEKSVLGVVRNMPPMEGLSWSSDGRYVALSSLKEGLLGRKPIDAIVLDASSGEVFLADTFDRYINNGGGIVLLSRADRSGTYLYYLLHTRVNDEPRLQFCRCPVEGGTREVLLDTAYDESAPYDLTSSSGLYEAADGSWMLSGVRGYSKPEKNLRQVKLALIRFTLSGGEWKPEVISLGIPAAGYRYALSGWSGASGYGAFCLDNLLGQYQASELASLSYSPAQEALSSAPRYVNFVRVLPGAVPSFDIWYLRKTGEGAGDAEFLPADGFLWSIKVNGHMLEESETAEAEEWIAGSQEEEGIYFPQEYGAAEYLEELEHSSLLPILGACISPDGYYALINAGSAESYRLYLVDLETMKLLPVEAPEGVGGTAVSATALGRSFAPGFVWNEDGTLLINGEGGVHALRLETGP